MRGITVITRFIRLHRLLGNVTYISPENRNFNMSGNMKIGTHSGQFHCDEALACFMLKLLPQYKDAVIIRSRDNAVLNTCDIVVDVGSVYDHSKRRYDHHMRDFKESQSTVMKKDGYDCQIKLSSAGLIYCHYGMEIIRHIVPCLNDADLEALFKQVYNTFIKEIDAIDNGIYMYDGESRYNIVTDLSSRVNRINPSWNSKGVDPDKQFLKAVELVGQELVDYVNYTANVWLTARSILKESIEKRFEVDPSGEIIELPQFVLWSDHLFALEKELNVEPSLKYIIFKDDTYRIRCVPVQPGSFRCRIFLPEPWQGLTEEKLANVCGIEGAVFVHSVGFCGANKTRDGALAMARKSLQLAREKTN